MDVVISPSNVKLSKQGGLFHVINEFRDEGERVGISDCMGVQVAVILTRMQGSTFLQYKEEERGLGRSRGYNPSCFKVLFDESFASFHLHWIQQVDFGNFRDKVRAKFNGMIIGAMGRELVMGLF